MYLQDIITSEVRVRLLIELFSDVDNNLYVRELTRRVGTEVNAIRRELKRLSKAGIVKKEQRGNRLYYIVRKDYVYYYELLSMISKESGIGKMILDNFEKLGKLRLVILSCAFLEGRKSKQDELDLLLVGEANLDVVESLMKEAGVRFGKEINYTVLSENDYNVFKTRREPFLLSFLVAPNILLVGSPEKYLYI